MSPTSPLRQRPALAALAALASLAACGPGPAEADRLGDAPRTDKVLLIVADTLRADHLSVYGYGRPTSPALERFAQGATRYARAQAAAPWTLPSHASMFTGLHPYEHGARTWPVPELAGLHAVGWTVENNAGPLAESQLTLAELLQGHGWATGGVVANLAFLDPRFGVAQGFDDWDQERGPVEDVTARALEWIDAHADGPFFLFVNFMDTHRPYNARPRPEFPQHPGLDNALARLAPQVLDPEGEPDPALVAANRDQYDTAIANLDEGLGRFFDGLRASDLFDEMLIVVTSDHGEFLGEKRLIEHSKDVYQGVLHVPLIVKAPGQATGAISEELIGHVHLPGLVLEHALLAPAPAARRRLTRHWPPSDEVLSENYYSRTRDLAAPWGARFRQVRRALVRGDEKLIVSSDGSEELYDLRADAGETRDLAGERVDATLSRRLAALLGALAAAPRPRAVDLDPALLEVLRQMGYAGEDE